ncbi:transcription initiation factor TFIIIB [Tubulinosema ratisbonensis]|uniref:B-related factor 1 n=1 Tax=Tubulinosema ratisbonensis TaxID=291195 RepID=A0A437AQ01_9MICR|nr:transcription initiation factor TFIIIB [Tubulinosema ratisbonensis]
MNCSNCNSSTFFTDYARCEKICEACGYVIQDNQLTSSLAFSSENGVSSLTGKIIEITQSFTKVNNTFIHSTSYNIENKIQSICTLLGLTSDFGQSAFRWYKLSLQYNISKAKGIIYTLSACIYLVCRQKKTPHFLIDFAHSLNINPFLVGRVFSKLVKYLNLSVEHNDPSIFLPRYFTKLKYINTEILSLSLRIIMRMKSDWISTGRRPNNLCGVSLLIAGRVYNEEKSVNEIALVVNGTVSTINKRLKELLLTETANLTINEFLSVWLEKEEDPPVLKQRKKNKIKKIMKNKENTSKENVQINLTENNNKEICDPNTLFTFDSDEDSELKNCLLTNEESKVRESLWNEMYSEFMQWKEKRIVEKKPVKKKKRVNSVGEAIKVCLEEKKLTNKIDFSAIKKLFE